MMKFVELGFVYNGVSDVFTPVIEVKSKKIMELYDKAYLTNLLLARLKHLDDIIMHIGYDRMDGQIYQFLKMDHISRFGQFRITDIIHTDSGLCCKIIHNGIINYCSGYYLHIHSGKDKKEVVKDIIGMKRRASVSIATNFHWSDYLPPSHPYNLKKISLTDAYGKLNSYNQCYELFTHMHMAFYWGNIKKIIRDNSICGVAFINALKYANKDHYNSKVAPTYKEFVDEFYKIITKFSDAGFELHPSLRMFVKHKRKKAKKCKHL